MHRVRDIAVGASLMGYHVSGNYEMAVAHLRASSRPELVDELIGYSAVKATWNPEARRVDWVRVEASEITEAPDA